ncbi:MAG: TetR/AcrR family transcriptional regulator [Anaeromicrobium sp.]|uniref:TetR/AcrR family transcriptional regulator n=1 Tax=Anaeromicrobium sp. TaxID=1929132 RepID=UPI0025F8234D|nr:TetR/AcrR family transcriptional regulator [Anaeromicrobium sp.]MCT4595316.1 TetR/AcrR family transcriptional regulator [Anaeromicrobium sp.]
MAKQIEGVYEKVITVAKSEFLQNGFQRASLRTIATKGGTTTGSIYTRFGDKEGLFLAIVEPFATKLLAMFIEIQENFHNFSRKDQREQMCEYTSHSVDNMIDFMYEHLGECKLLLEGSQGTKFENFTDDFISIEEEYTHKYIETVGCEICENLKFLKDIVHMITTAYFESFFEVIRHNMEKEEAKKYIKVLSNYHLAGFEAVFQCT